MIRCPGKSASRKPGGSPRKPGPLGESCAGNRPQRQSQAKSSQSCRRWLAFLFAPRDSGRLSTVIHNLKNTVPIALHLTPIDLWDANEPGRAAAPTDRVLFWIPRSTNPQPLLWRLAVFYQTRTARHQDSHRMIRPGGRIDEDRFGRFLLEPVTLCTDLDHGSTYVRKQRPPSHYSDCCLTYQFIPSLLSSVSRYRTVDLRYGDGRDQAA
jgi:hypothetical protein